MFRHFNLTMVFSSAFKVCNKLTLPNLNYISFFKLHSKSWLIIVISKIKLTKSINTFIKKQIIRRKIKNDRERKESALGLKIIY